MEAPMSERSPTQIIILEAQKGYGQEDSGAMVGIDRLNNSEECEQLKSVD